MNQPHRRSILVSDLVPRQKTGFHKRQCKFIKTVKEIFLLNPTCSTGFLACISFVRCHNLIMRSAMPWQLLHEFFLSETRSGRSVKPWSAVPKECVRDELISHVKVRLPVTATDKYIETFLKIYLILTG